MYQERLQGEEGPLTARNLLYALALHLALFLVFWGLAKLVMRPPETIIPIDMTIVPPWAEQTDDPDPDPNPPPKEAEPPKPAPKPPEPEPEKVEPKPVEAVEKVVEKKKPEKKPVDFKAKAKFVKESPKPLDLRERAKKVDAPVMRKTGKATAADKPMTPEEFMRYMNQGYRIGARNQLATSEAQRCVSMIAQAIKREWDKESFKWYPGLEPLQVQLSLGPGGRVKGFRILRGSGDGDVDRTAQAALRRLHAIPGLSATFLEQFADVAILMEPTANN